MSEQPNLLDRHSLKKVSIVIPLLNEQDNLPVLYQRLQQLAGKRPELEFEFIFVNDGSTDQYPRLLNSLANEDARVRVIHLCRNFGHQNAATAGLDAARGDAVALIDADLQDPPELIEPMLAEIESGWDIVYGKRRRRKKESYLKLATAHVFYRFLSRMTSVDIPLDTGDFRVMHRQVVESLRTMRENHRFLRGMVAWVGFRSKPFLYDRDARHAGVSKYPLRKMILFAMDAIFSFSVIPLRLSFLLGMLVTLIGVFGVIYIVALKVLIDDYIPGISATLLAVLVLGGTQLISVGIIGEYVGRIHEQMKHRPLYIVAATRNLAPRNGEHERGRSISGPDAED